jgi:hypothetical protein
MAGAIRPCRVNKGSQFWFRWKIRSENWYFFSQSDLSIFATIDAPIPKIFPKKIRLKVTSIDISSCWWRGHGEGAFYLLSDKKILIWRIWLARTGRRLCHLSLELRLVQTGVRLKSELMLCSLPRSRLLSYHMLEVPPRRAQKNRKRTNFYRTLSNNFAIFLSERFFIPMKKFWLKKSQVSSANQITPFRSDFSSESKLTTLTKKCREVFPRGEWHSRSSGLA